MAPAAPRTRLACAASCGAAINVGGGIKLRPCQACRAAPGGPTYYCSVEHQKQDWRRHKAHCCASARAAAAAPAAPPAAPSAAAVPASYEQLMALPVRELRRMLSEAGPAGAAAAAAAVEKSDLARAVLGVARGAAAPGPGSGGGGRSGSGSGGGAGGGGSGGGASGGGGSGGGGGGGGGSAAAKAQQRAAFAHLDAGQLASVLAQLPGAPPAPRGAGREQLLSMASPRGACGAAAPPGVCHPDMLAEIFAHLPPREQCALTAGLGRPWRAWAAARWLAREAGAARPRFKRPPLPLALARDAWSALPPPERRAAAQRAAAAGRLSVLRFAIGAGGVPLDETLCEEAARGGHVDALAALRGAGAPWDRRTCRAAVLGDHVDALAFAIQGGCAPDRGAPLLASELGHLAALRALRGAGCPWDADECRCVAEARGHADVVDFIDRNRR
ncbi:MAG: hypothetical protein J3K34DRAFT_495990 [Monoraphidium minutum]|nr:MAG: hypothetical protein J3K34DRAFT_495990 [Monoraphidium minutum]